MFDLLYFIFGTSGAISSDISDANPLPKFIKFLLLLLTIIFTAFKLYLYRALMKDVAADDTESSSANPINENRY